jgi:hypothetical protein
VWASWLTADATRPRCYKWPDPSAPDQRYRDRLRAVFLFERNAYRFSTVWGTLMEKLLLVAALACQPGDRLIDLSGRLPRGLQYMDFVVSVEPFYTRFYIYQLGFPESFQQCCSNKPTSVLRVPIGTGRFCIRQSQSQMKWRVRALLRPDIEM